MAQSSWLFRIISKPTSHQISWAFSQSVLADIWSVKDGESPEWFVEIVLAFKKNFKAELDFS